MFYDRKIRYLNYYESGERICGSGFVKTEARDTTLRIEITVKAKQNIAGNFPIILLKGEKEAPLGEVRLQEGRGEFRHTCQIMGGIGETGISFSELEGIRIPLEAGKEITCRWEMTPQKEKAVDSLKLEAQGHVEESMAEEAPEEEVPIEKVPVKKAPAKEASAKKAPAKEAPAKKASAEEASVEETSQETEKELPEKNPSESDKIVRLQEDKWTQLCTIYPHIRPFRDEREYLSIGPADFVLFPAADYRAAHNSFLLHGYYNYHHLILTRVERRGEILYYLGVPGNYFDKEKQVAVMFGFESFECAEEPAEYGDFGYYMMRTNI